MSAQRLHYDSFSRQVDENISDANEDEERNGSNHVQDIWKESERESLLGGNQVNGIQSLVQTHESSKGLKNDVVSSWNWPNTGYSSLKQWASSNNMTSFPTNNRNMTSFSANNRPMTSFQSKVVPNNDSVSSSCMLPSPVDDDSPLTLVQSPYKTKQHLPRDKLSSSGSHKKGRSEAKWSATMGGLRDGTSRGPRIEDLFGSARGVTDGENEKIKQEKMEISDNEHLSCHVCNFVGSSEEDFRGHMSIHFRQRCTLCDYTCRTAGRLRRHAKEYHNDQSPSSSSTALVTTHFGPVRDAGLRKNYHCRHCSYSTVERDNYWEHKLVHIPTARQLRCPYDCKFVTDLKHHLVYHLLNHSGTKPYHCDRCSYDCINKSMLNSHMKSHSNYYPYRCFHCSFASKYPHPMKVHEKKRGHKRIQLIPSSAAKKEVPPLTCLTDFRRSGTSPAKSESKAGTGIVELISPIGSSQAPSKKRDHKRIKNSSQLLSQSQTSINPNLLQNFPQFPMGFAPSGGYFFPGFLPTNGWMFPPFAGRLPLGGVLPQMNAMSESWFKTRKALASSEDDPQRKPNLSSATPPMKSVEGRDINNTGQMNLLQSMNFIQSNVMFNFSQNYASPSGGGRGGQMISQQLKCSLCYFVANTAVGLLQHTMIAHTAASLLSNAHSTSNDFLEAAHRPLSQSTPTKQHKLWENSAARTLDHRLSNVVGNGKATGEKYRGANTMLFPQADTFASYARAECEEYNRILTQEITASIEREQKKRIGDFKPDQNVVSFGDSMNNAELKRECQDIEEIEGEEDGVPILSIRHRLSSTSSLDDVDPSVPRTPIKQRSGSISKLDLISTRLQSRQQQGSGSSSQGYHTSNLSSSSMKEISANSGASWPIGSPISPQEIAYSSPNGESQPTHTGCRSRRPARVQNTDEPEDLSLVGRMREKDIPRTPSSSSSLLGVSAVRCLNEKFSDANESADKEKCRELKPPVRRQSSFDDVRVGPYPHECRHCKLMFSDYAMYCIHMEYHGREDPFECNRCGKFTDNEIDFFNHIGTTEH